MCLVTVGDIYYALESIIHPGSVGQITESQGFDAAILSVNEDVSGSSGRWLGHAFGDNGFRGSAHLAELLFVLVPGSGGRVSSWV